MLFQEAKKLRSGDIIYINNQKEPNEIISVTVNKEEKTVKFILANGEHISHKDAKMFPKPDKNEKYADKGISFEDAKALKPNDLIYVKAKNEIQRIKSEPRILTDDIIEIETTDGNKITNKEIQLAPKDAKEGKLPF